MQATLHASLRQTILAEVAILYKMPGLMSIRDILTYPDPRLRQKAMPVADPMTTEVQQLVRDLVETMYDAPGVGLAATQLGVPMRVAITDIRGEDKEPNLRVWINPEIVYAEGSKISEEGCLSVPDYYADVERNARIQLRWLDEKGKACEEVFDDFQAVALQHEFDHLDGRLFIDLLPPMKQKLIKKKLKKQKKLAA